MGSETVNGPTAPAAEATQPDWLGADTTASMRHQSLERLLGYTDPHAHLFAEYFSRPNTGALKNYPDLLAKIEREHLARFEFFSRGMAETANFEQMLLLGVGYDTRALWLPQLVASQARIFEVDLPELLEAKAVILLKHGIQGRPNVIPVGLDLRADPLIPRLEAAGFDPKRPTSVMLEGVAFHLPPSLTARVLDPRQLRLVAGSQVRFDAWSKGRIARNNAWFRVRTGHSRFFQFPFPDAQAALEGTLAALGYRDIRIDHAGSLAKRLWPGEHRDARDDWPLVTATVA